MAMGVEVAADEEVRDMNVISRKGIWQMKACIRYQNYDWFKYDIEVNIWIVIWYYDHIPCGYSFDFRIIFSIQRPFLKNWGFLVETWRWKDRKIKAGMALASYTHSIPSTIAFFSCICFTFKLVNNLVWTKVSEINKKVWKKSMVSQKKCKTAIG